MSRTDATMFWITARQSCDVQSVMGHVTASEATDQWVCAARQRLPEGPVVAGRHGVMNHVSAPAKPPTDELPVLDHEPLLARSVGPTGTREKRRERRGR